MQCTGSAHAAHMHMQCTCGTHAVRIACHLLQAGDEARGYDLRALATLQELPGGRGVPEVVLVARAKAPPAKPRGTAAARRRKKRAAAEGRESDLGSVMSEATYLDELGELLEEDAQAAQHAPPWPSAPLGSGQCPTSAAAPPPRGAPLGGLALSGGVVGPLGAPPLPQVLEGNLLHSTAFDHAGATRHRHDAHGDGDGGAGRGGGGRGGRGGCGAGGGAGGGGAAGATASPRRSRRGGDREGCGWTLCHQ